MPTLILPPRYSEDSNTIWRTAVQMGWNIERLQSWRVPENFSPQNGIVIYGESIWASFVAQQLGYSLYEPPLKSNGKSNTDVSSQTVKSKRSLHIGAVRTRRGLSPAGTIHRYASWMKPTIMPLKSSATAKLTLERAALSLMLGLFEVRDGPLSKPIPPLRLVPMAAIPNACSPSQPRAFSQDEDARIGEQTPNLCL